MGGAVPPLPQYAFMAWCSVRASRGTTLLYFLSLRFYSSVLIMMIVLKKPSKQKNMLVGE
jgi:hypothetical protein